MIFRVRTHAQLSKQIVVIHFVLTQSKCLVRLHDQCSLGMLMKIGSHVIILVSGVIFVFAGLLLMILFPPDSLLFKLILAMPIEIGFALIIAFAVAQMIESQSRKDYDRFTQEKAKLLSQNVFGYLYSVKFPKEAFIVLEKYLFSKPIIKTYQKLDYELVLPEIAPGWIKMRCELDYALKNLSEKSERHKIRFYFSKVTTPDEPEVSGIGLQSLMVGETSISPDKFDELDQAADDEVGQHKFEYECDIAPNEELTVRVVFTQLKRVSDNDLFQSGSVCNSLELKLRYDPTQFDVYVEPVHPGNEFSREIRPNGGDHCHVVRIDQPLLPKNGVFMWWNRRTHPPAPTATGASA